MVEAAAASLTIDDFSTDQSVYTFGASSVLDSFLLTPSGAIGDRTLNLSPGSHGYGNALEIADGKMGFIARFGDVNSFAITYGKSDNASSTPLDMNFSAYHSFQIGISYWENKSPSVSHPLEIAVTGGSTRHSASVILSGPGTWWLPFSDFPGIDWADVDAIRLSMTAVPESFDYQLDKFRIAVPIPGAIWLLGSGLLLGLGMRKRLLRPCNVANPG